MSINPTENTPRIAKPPKPRILANLFRPTKIAQTSEIRAAGICTSKRILPTFTGQKKNPSPMKEMGFW
jgi:hypothetical protein